MKIIKKLLFVILILISTMAVAGPLELSIAQKAIPETAQMLLLGLLLVVLASYGRKRIYKK
jgi:membrane protease YdiL (CAAX protease family)